MSGILGFTFHLGPEVPRPTSFDWTQGWSRVEHARKEWADAIVDAVRYEDAWGLLCMAPDGDVTLRDVLTPGAIRDWATGAARVWLLLAREVSR